MTIASRRNTRVRKYTARSGKEGRSTKGFSKHREDGIAKEIRNTLNVWFMSVSLVSTTMLGWVRLRWLAYVRLGYLGLG